MLKEREREVRYHTTTATAPTSKAVILKLRHGLLKNTWFGNDTAMTYTAFDIHKKLVEVEGL